VSADDVSADFTSVDDVSEDSAEASAVPASSRLPFYHRLRHTGYLRHLLVRKASFTGEILVDLVTTTQRQPDLSGFANSLLELQEKGLLKGSIAGILHTKNDSPADVVVDQGTEVLYGKDFFTEELLGLRFKVTPFSFFQTNSHGAEVLYDTARSYLSVGSEAGRDRGIVYDLYSGTGTIAQLMAPAASRVIGVEIVEEAVEAARINAVENGLTNCEFIAGDVLKVLDTIEQKPDTIILDPPRDGIHPKALPKILSYGVDNILYISCKPTSLARDLPAFIAAGYRPVRGVCVDQFPWTSSVETVCLLSVTRQI
jgi:23S rRNA (uracil-5-)-methyltransferase RumA